MIKNNKGEVEMMTRTELEKENQNVIYGYGSTYLNFNLGYFVELANKKHFRLWEAMLKVDQKATIEEKMEELHKLLDFLLE